MRFFTLALLATSALTGAPAFAADAVSDDAPATAPTAAAATTEGADNDIVVFGRGETRQVQDVRAETIELLAPGTSPMKAVERLPGVNFQSADPFGAYEWSQRISIRGFNQNQLGFTFDGIPLGDMSYGNHNGLHISRAIISENVGRVEVAQGAGSLAAASSSNLGGTIEFFSREPAERLGIDVAGTWGSDENRRIFARLDSGEIVPGGPRLSLSYAWQDADKWKGDGAQRQDQVNARIVQPVGDGQVFAFVNYSNRRDNDYQDLSAEMIGRLGYKWDNFAKNWDYAVLIASIYQNQNARAAYNAGIANGTIPAGTPFVAPYAGVGETFPLLIKTVDDAYYDASGLRKDWLAGVGLDVPFNDYWSMKLQGYYHGNDGRGLWYTPYVVTPGGAPITIRTTEYEIERYGIVASSSVTIGANAFEIGMWYEETTSTRHGASMASPTRAARRAAAA